MLLKPTIFLIINLVLAGVVFQLGQPLFNFIGFFLLLEGIGIFVYRIIQWRKMRS